MVLTAPNHRPPLTRARPPLTTDWAVFWGLLVVAEFQVLRDYWSGFYAIISAIFCVALVISAPAITRWGSGGTAWLVDLYIASAIWAALHTITIAGAAATLYASARFFLLIPLCPLAYACMRSSDRMRRLLEAYSWIIVIGVASLAWQYVFGPIPWLAHYGQRAGIDRFASLLGSITAIGIGIPIALMITFCLDGRRGPRLIQIPILVIGIFLSLSKAAILGTALVIALSLLLRAKARRKNLILTISIATVAAALIAGRLVRTGPGTHMVDYVYAILDPSAAGAASARGGDVSAQNSLISRLTALPEYTLNKLSSADGLAGYVGGGGFTMVGTSLMETETSTNRTAHNQYIDTLAIGGFAMLAAYMGILGCSLSTLLHAAREERSGGPVHALCGVVIFLIVASAFTGGIPYQPVSGAPFWVAAGAAAWLTKRRKLETRAIRVRGGRHQIRIAAPRTGAGRAATNRATTTGSVSLRGANHL